MSIWEYANPTRFMQWSARPMQGLFIVGAAATLGGVGWGFFGSPDDARQGASVKIIYLHVPAALMAINLWFMMLVSSIIWIVRRHHVSALCAKAAALVGLTMTLIALLTGAAWGAPIWGTFWAWDPRLTSFLILCLFYIGYIALWSSLEDPDTAADLTSILCCAGSVFAVLSRYATQFWNQGLHQDASLSLDKEEHVADVFYYPLILSMIGVAALCLALVILRTRTEVNLRKLRAYKLRQGEG